ncbi:Fur family transcriptional regulator [Balneolales bacterium ANBcel1]|nr:Fur family transcriptional regulator [Balneolales bacterium ANBcel1]
MQRNDEPYRQLLRQNGLKATPARLNVLNILAESNVALSHGDITTRLEGFDIDKVTLYRTLDTFIKSGLAHKVATEDRNWLYALHLHEDDHIPKDDPHAHFICDGCDRIYCLPVQAAAITPEIKNSGGFLIKTQEYRLHGTCPDCL